jgi:hypothetical protein
MQLSRGLTQFSVLAMLHALTITFTSHNISFPPRSALSIRRIIRLEKFHCAAQQVRAVVVSPFSPGIKIGQNFSGVVGDREDLWKNSDARSRPWKTRSSPISYGATKREVSPARPLNPNTKKVLPPPAPNWIKD